MPPETVYVGRGTPWGNPFVIGRHYSMDEDGFAFLEDGANDAAGVFYISNNSDAVKWFAERMKRRGLWPGHYHFNELKGKNLACWCKPDEPCHADILLQYAIIRPKHG